MWNWCASGCCHSADWSAGDRKRCDRVHRRDRVARALLAVESPRPADVGQRGVVVVGVVAGVRGVVPVAGRHPVVGPLLLAGRAEDPAGVVLGRGDDRLLEAGLAEAGQRGGLLLVDRRVVAPAEVKHAGVVAQPLPDRQRRLIHHVVILGRHAAPAGRWLPLVAALEAGVDQDAGPVHLVVEVLRHLLALGPDPVQAHGLDHRDLARQVGRRVVQEQVLRPAARAVVKRHAVDLEDPDALGRLRRRLGQVRADLPDAEFHRRRRVGRAGAAGSTGRARHGAGNAGAQRVERLAAHLVRPPQPRVLDDERGVARRGERHRRARAGRERDRPRYLDAGPAARRRDRRGHDARLRRAGVVGHVRVHGQRRRGHVRRVILRDVGVGDAQRVRDVQLDGELNARVVIRRYLGPVHVVEREHRRRVVRVQLQGQHVLAGAEQARDVEGVAGVVALDGGLGRDLGAVDPDVGLPDDPVDDEPGVLARLEVRRRTRYGTTTARRIAGPCRRPGWSSAGRSTWSGCRSRTRCAGRPCPG